jgi:hypothetical protein
MIKQYGNFLIFLRNAHIAGDGNMDKKHVHKFRRHTYTTGNIVYFCALPDCNVKIKPVLTLGKRAICWLCGNEFIMNEYSIRLAKPHCQDCHKIKSTGKGEGEEPVVLTPSIPSIALKDRLLGLTAKDDGEDI